MAARSVRSKTPLDWLIAVVAVAAVSIGATLLSTHLFDQAKAERITAADSDAIVVDSIYDDRIEGAHDPNYGRDRYQAIATSFAADPVYFDGYPEFEIDEGDVDSIRAEIAEADSPIYVAFLNVSDLDDADGDLDLLAARIVTEMDDPEAAVLTVDATGRMGLAEKGLIRPSLLTLSGDFDDSDSDAALAGVRKISAAETENVESRYSHRHDDDGNPEVTSEDTTKDPHTLSYSTGGAVAGAVFGILVGAGIVVGTYFIRRALKKRTAKQ